MEIPVLFDEGLENIIAEGKTVLEEELGRTIGPADVEMLLLNGFSYLRQLDYIKSNEAARQNLLAFARGVMLDYLGELLGVTRLPGSGAACKIRFTAVAGHPDFVIPAGVRVQSIDRQATFATLQQKTVLSTDNYVDVDTIATETGKTSNGYAATDISVILDPVPYVTTASNTDITAGGSDTETDEELRKRIQEAPARFSVAGPVDAYKYFAESANPAIIDVAITSPNPGEVKIWPLLEGGVLPNSGVLAQVAAVCNADKVRPLTDTVITAAPVKTDYTITAALTLLNSAVESLVLAQVNAALLNFKTEGQNILGRDVMRNKLIALCMVPGVYNVSLTQPDADIVANPYTYANCTTITVTVAGYNEG